MCYLCLRPLTRGSTSSTQLGLVQRVATVYIDGEEYRVSAPPDATGETLDWAPHLKVTQLDNFGAEVELGWSGEGLVALEAVKKELEKQKGNECGATGMHPDSARRRPRLFRGGPSEGRRRRNRNLVSGLRRDGLSSSTAHFSN